MALTVARIAFIGLFLLCNVNLGPSAVPGLYSIFQMPPKALALPISYDDRQWQPRSAGDVPFFNSDIIFFIILSCFGLSNGWLTSLLMMAAPSLEHNKRMKREWVDLAAVGASFRYAFLVSWNGLTVGAEAILQSCCRPCHWIRVELCD
jgi:hypothetical protein